MKTKLFFLLITCSLFGQNAELLNNNWYVSQIVTNGQTTNAVSLPSPLGSSKFTLSGSDYVFISYYFNTAGNNVIFSSSQNSFTKNQGSCTLAQYVGVNQDAVRDFDQKHCDFYVSYIPVGTIFNYQIINNGSSKILAITNATTGNIIYYNNSILGTKENALKKTFRIYPNPSSDFLIVENIDKNLKVKIYDVSGKIIYETLSSGKALKINTENFQKGQYILSIENSKSEFFIKS
ncbi:hypothetical protein IX39_11710 [Chryseobacterium formosense]|uniref:Secretion system C-terminal sorting domain-containing protein n=2 Tax=Chryseobacterium formosense TaxID=236814 RepID=A0A085Z9Y0_9FLAO|nr:hypothetical protein IX39_11710 [Chryseobacterium formosense]SFT44498.1 Por secretion system C-terminal sorting domain-containing protein [Chryseobacterium formosense]